MCNLPIDKDPYVCAMQKSGIDMGVSESKKSSEFRLASKGTFLQQGEAPKPLAGLGVKHDEGKVDYSLLPVEAMEEILKVFSFGAKKYERFNYRKGFKQSRLLAAALRHITAHMKGQDTDEESGLGHLAHAGCCIMMLLSNIIEGKDDDDRYA